MSAQEHKMQIQRPRDIVPLFDMTPAQISERMHAYCADTRQQVIALLAIPEAERTFANTIEEYDRIVGYSPLSVHRSVVAVLSMVHPDAQIRDAANQAALAMNEFMIDLIGSNHELYYAGKAYAEGNALHENLSQNQWYYLNDFLEGCRKEGLGLPKTRSAQVSQLKKEISALCIAFQNNISHDNRTIAVTREGLQGVSEYFINGLTRSEDGLYILGVDYPTRTAVMEHCRVEETRKLFYRAFTNRAYPVNDAVLQDIFQKRHALANLLDFETFAHADLSFCMAKDPAVVETFLLNLLEKASGKELAEFRKSTKELPVSVELTADGRLKPWDIAYLHTSYVKKHFALDEQVIAEYFPQESVMKGLFDIYETFFSLTFKEAQVQGLWHEDVRAIEVYAKDSAQLLGCLLLDLHPRPHKYSHACEANIIPAIVCADGTKPPAVAVVIANFARSTATQPALWHRTQAVRTFFHEFGHALHDVLGRTRLAGVAGTSTKIDFVELPSQMLEYWLEDHAIIKNLSKHYQTGAQLPDEIAEQIKAVEQCYSGFDVRAQIIYALLSLTCHQNTGKLPNDIVRELHEKIASNVAFDPENHFYASFGHLSGYGARYYGYLWSQVFARDIFAEIKKHGLLNSEIGARYVEEILSKGGSKDPSELLYAFLQRKPNHDAFLASLGFADERVVQEVLAVDISATVADGAQA